MGHGNPNPKNSVWGMVFALVMQHYGFQLDLDWQNQKNTCNKVLKSKTHKHLAKYDKHLVATGPILKSKKIHWIIIDPYCSFTGQPRIGVKPTYGLPVQTVKLESFEPRCCNQCYRYHTHGDMGVLLQEFLHPPQASWAQQDWTQYTGTRLPAAEVIYMIFGYTATYVLYTCPLKSSSLSHPINHAAGEDDTCHILLRSLLWAQCKTTLATPINPATAAVIPVVPHPMPFAPFTVGTIVGAVPAP